MPIYRISDIPEVRYIVFPIYRKSDISDFRYTGNQIYRKYVISYLRYTGSPMYCISGISERTHMDFRYTGSPIYRKYDIVSTIYRKSNISYFVSKKKITQLEGSGLNMLFCFVLFSHSPLTFPQFGFTFHPFFSPDRPVAHLVWQQQLNPISLLQRSH